MRPTRGDKLEQGLRIGASSDRFAGIIRRMNDETIRAALRDGFELEERVVANEWVWGWARGDDARWPCYRTRDEAVRWMADRLNRVRVFG